MVRTPDIGRAARGTVRADQPGGSFRCISSLISLCAVTTANGILITGPHPLVGERPTAVETACFALGGLGESSVDLQGASLPPALGFPLRTYDIWDSFYLLT